MPKGGRPPLPEAGLRRLATSLATLVESGTEAGAEEVALLVDHGRHAGGRVEDERVLFARGSALGPSLEGAGLLRPPRCLASQAAVLALLLGVHEGFPGRAHLLARRRIWTTAPWRRTDRELVRVGGSTLSAGLQPLAPGDVDDTGPGPRVRDVRDVGQLAREAVQRAQASAGEASARAASALGLHDGLGAERAGVVGVEGAVRAVRALRAAPPSEADGEQGALVPRSERDRPVAAVVLDEDQRLVGAAVNANGKNRMLHAEVCAVLSGLVPPGGTVVVSLKPCRMCAALLVEVTGGSLQVVYVDDDPGRLARGSVLDGDRRLLRWPP